MSVYNLAVNHFIFRAVYSKLNGIIPDLINNGLFLISIGSMVSGPLIAYFDRYTDVHTHVYVTAIFVICEVLYLLIVPTIILRNSDKFETKYLGLLAIGRLALIIVFGILLYCKLNDIELYGWSAVGEWILFEVTFLVRFFIALVIDYSDVVVSRKKII